MAAAVPVLVTLTAAAYSAYSSVKAGKAQKRADDRSADRAEYVAETKAADTEKQHRRIIAAQKARYGASGLTQEGSPLLVQQESLKESKEQLRRILEGGQYVADTYRDAGEEAENVGSAGAIKSLLGGATSTYNIGANYNWW